MVGAVVQATQSSHSQCEQQAPRCAQPSTGNLKHLLALRVECGVRQVRKGYNNGEDNTHTWISQAPSWGVSAATLHGRTRQQR